MLHGLTLSYILGINVNKRSQYVNVGVDVHLPCHNTVDPEDCSSTTWHYSRAGIENAITAVSMAKVRHNSQRTKRLSVKAGYSIYLPSVTAEDAGLYTCRVNNRTPFETDNDTYLSILNAEFFC